MCSQHLLPIPLSPLPGSQHKQKCMTHLMELMPAVQGRCHFSNLGRGGGLSSHTYPRWLARSLAFTRQTLAFLQLVVPADHWQVWA